MVDVGATGHPEDMQRGTPWTLTAIVALGAFIVWLAIQMSRTDRADRIVLTIAVCFGLIGVALALGMIGRGRHRRS